MPLIVYTYLYMTYTGKGNVFYVLRNGGEFSEQPWYPADLLHWPAQVFD